MRIPLLIFLLITGCSNASELNDNTTKSQRCEITFTSQTPCSYNGVSVKLHAETLGIDEKSLQSLEVFSNSTNQTLEISPDTSLIEGDKGYISLSDINFDEIPDIAITTSFGVANLYLDYWVFDTDKKQYVFIGNYGELKLDLKNQMLSNVIKINAASYQNNYYVWDGYTLKIK